MNRSASKVLEDKDNDALIQENVVNWQSATNPLAPLKEEQLDLFYEVGDVLKSLYANENNYNNDDEPAEHQKENIPVISSNIDFVRWMVSVEKQIQHENFKHFQVYYELLSKHLNNSQHLLTLSDQSLNSLSVLREKYENVIEKTHYLHNLSEQLMVQQKCLKEKKSEINHRLKYFIYFPKCQDIIENMNKKVNNTDFIDALNNIDLAIDYLKENMSFKESKIYKIKYESLLNTALMHVFNFVNNILIETSKQIITGSENNDLSLQHHKDSVSESIFALYYGKFQSSSVKMKKILEIIEQKQDKNDHYKNTMYDCQTSYFKQRLPILEAAVSKALQELNNQHRTDYSVLFRSCCLFTVKVCTDEVMCYNFFFSSLSSQLHDYLSSLCQHLYDTLRPCLIHINHIEILCELCSILKNEMSNDKNVTNECLTRYFEVIRQLLEDVEERLVFRVNMFFKHDLSDYKPSPGDLAYPEKLQQMINVIEIKERRPDSRSSIRSGGSQDMTNLDVSHMSHLRSYTGNSPADLHGMWYPTVKRTLVCLSRLYFCLDRETFQSLAQEALIICVNTLQNASGIISSRKTPVDGKLFEIKHLLIIREQIAPFQVDFTSKELSLDFSTVQKAAVDLVQKRKQIFTFGSNNALLEFLLEGTPKVKEYLIDSRKEIDKKLKFCCESFIAFVTKMLIGNVLDWNEQAEAFLQVSKGRVDTVKGTTLSKQIFAKPENLSDLVKEAEKCMKLKIPEIQRSMQLYLANKETEFILFRPIKNNIINAFIQMEQIVQKGGYTTDDQLLIACPTPEHVNILICSVSLTGE
ncbi:hypothetical protein GWI33_016070 [Rhynchophorus ferrugineus]|uniref:Conserved oligomeric Golgi complex subunit 3 n=1 Tax=Rhynchophorus ferrugineus TaxID=354439 RepID=A0A834HYM7_RHYFE|nr:hypothetical protein GWI33_016070 [Rhynchophorus ferrugineus]